MSERGAYAQSCAVAWRAFAPLRQAAGTALLLAFAVFATARGANGPAVEPGAVTMGGRRCCVTNTAQFPTISSADYLAGCDFRLTGLITLVDTNRELLVLQDATGAVAIHFPFAGLALQVGELVTLDGTDCSPLLTRFPDYPCRPSGRETRRSFEAPMNWGEYYLTRMRGWLRPRVTGQYSFWIASDNSSELWLSPDADASKARKLAFVLRFEWVEPREWSRYPSQHSEPVLLEAGRSYYIEALQEQQGGADHLAVAWQGPGLDRAVIAGEYLSPPKQGLDVMDMAANGVLREYWTNFTSGDLTGLGGARSFESALAVRAVRAHIQGVAELPAPVRIPFNQPLRSEDNYRWVEADGTVKFKGQADGTTTALLDLSDGQSLVQVRALHWNPGLSRCTSNSFIHVQGVCEGIYDQTGRLMPQLIWASASNCISFLLPKATDAAVLAINRPTQAAAPTNAPLQGYYGTRAVVTFNDHVFGKDYIFVQEDANAIRLMPDSLCLARQPKVGRWVEFGGALEPGKYSSIVRPIFVTDLGPHSMPAPIARPLKLPSPGELEGRWSEIEGVVHSVNQNGTLSIVNQDGSACLWLPQSASNHLVHYVDATLRARGVLSFSILDGPMLLVPSWDYVDLEEPPAKRPFDIPRCAVAELFPEATHPPPPHRVRVAGVVTYCDAQSFFIQDASGGIRVRPSEPSPVGVGQTVEVLAFPAEAGLSSALTEALVRPSPLAERVAARDLNLRETVSSRQNGSLVRVSAVLLGRTTNNAAQELELQQRQQLFTTTLAAGHGELPEIALGSRVTVTGVLDVEGTMAPGRVDKPARVQLPSLDILLRSPQDVAPLSGPPWWTWKQAALLVGTLLTVLVVALLWVYFLRQRLERQQAAQLVFSRNVLARLEAERRRIAANLHDGLGQMLLVIKSQAIWATQGAPDEPGWRERLDEIGDATSQAIEEVRRITHGLRPYQLDRLGLTQAIRTLVARASENSSILFASRVEDIDELFDKDEEIHVYRIVQEAVNNIVKHSEATEATVVVKKRAVTVSLSIRDNGRGIPATLSDESHDLGYGLKGIAERVRILGGTLTMDSHPGEGTSTTVEIPLSISRNDTGTSSSHC